MTATAQSEYGTLRRVVLKHARDGFGDDRRIAGEWNALNFTAPPDRERAFAEYDTFVEILSRSGTEIEMLPDVPGTGLDSIYVRDASIVCDRGVVLCRMGKVQREAEPGAQQTALRAAGCAILGSIHPPGQIEGGDVT